MKYTLIILIFSTYLVGCPGPYEQLDQIRATKRDCANYKTKYDEVKPVKNSKEIEEKIKECKDVGAW